MNWRRLSLIHFVLLFFLFSCTKHIPKPTPPPPPVSPIEGVWESTGRKGPMKMTFYPDGRVMFQDGLEFFNPGRWDYDPLRHTLAITFPQADDDKLQVFKTYLKDGVLAFDRMSKTITYRFDEQTSSLNIAGWIYTKIVKQDIQIPAEPVLR